MSRLIFFAVIGAVIYWLLKSYRSQLTKEQDKEQATPRATEDMVRCVHCGIHLPKHESVETDVGYFCSEAHRYAHRDKTQ